MSVETVNKLAFRNGEPASLFNGTNPKSPQSSQHSLKRHTQKKRSKISAYSEKGNGKKRFKKKKTKKKKKMKNQTTCCEQ